MFKAFCDFFHQSEFFISAYVALLKFVYDIGS